MRAAQRWLALGALAFGATANAACDYPFAPEDLPTGETESEQDMLTAQGAIKDYVKAMEDYLVCIDEQITALGEDASSEQKLMYQKRYNAAVEVMDATASEFNQAVRTYKARGN